VVVDVLARGGVTAAGIPLLFISSRFSPEQPLFTRAADFHQSPMVTS
jgi:hypothetical protein